MLVDVEWRSEPLHPGQARSSAQLTLLFVAIIVGVVQCVSITFCLVRLEALRLRLPQLPKPKSPSLVVTA